MTSPNDLEVYDELLEEERRMKKHVCPFCRERFIYVANWRKHLNECN